MTPADPSDPPLRTVALPSGPAGVVEEGRGVPVVLLHGLPGTHRDFRWLAAAFEGQVRVIRPDQPGYGGTPAATGRGFTPSDRAAFVVEVLDALGIDKAVVVGHSMGGPAAVAVAEGFPDRVLGLGLLASAGRRPHRLLRQIPVPRLLAASMGLPVAGPPLRRLVQRSLLASGFKGVDEATAWQVMRHVAATDLADNGRRLATVRVPTLVAWTRDDQLVEDDIGEELYWAAPQGPRIVFEVGGHNLQKSRAVELAQALVAWVRQL